MFLVTIPFSLFVCFKVSPSQTMKKKDITCQPVAVDIKLKNCWKNIVELKNIEEYCWNNIYQENTMRA